MAIYLVFSGDATRTNGSNKTSTDTDFRAAASGVNRREFLNVGLAGAALLALMGCGTFRGSKKSDLDKATTDLRKLL